MHDAPDIRGYRLLSELGQGGVAVVYEAEVLDLARQSRDETSEDSNDSTPPIVALKTLKPEALAQQNVVASFQYETRVLSRLDHPNILRLFDTGAQDGVAYAAVELIEGEPLDDVLIRRGKLKQAEALDFAIQLVDALDHIHEQGYVHRDIKHGNLMLTKDGRLVLMDFGTVVKAGAKIDYEEGLYGTVPFLSPEQIEQRPTIDGRADLYATAVLLYRMVAGVRPFQGTREDVLDAHLHLDPKPPSNYANISPELDALILKNLAKSPEGRNASAAEMLAELKAIEMAGDPPKPSLAKTLFGWLRPG